MTPDEILRLARESGVWDMLVTYSGEFLDGNPEADCLPELMRFAALVEEHLNANTIHSCHPDCTKPACVAVRKAVEAEREACAKVCDTTPPYPFRPSIEAAHAIRARSRT